MKNRNYSKILVLAISVALLIGAIVGIVASAESAPEIIGKNIQYGADLKFQIAIDADSVGGAGKTVYVKTYADDTKATLLDTVVAEYKDTSKTNLGVANAYVALSKNSISALAYNTEFYIVAECDGKETAITYSAIEYFLERLYGDDVTNATTEKGKAQKALYNNAISYGSSAQTLAALEGKYEGKNVADYFYYAAEDGSVNGVASGVAAKDTVLTLGTYAGSETGMSRWEIVDLDSGERVALVKPGEKVSLTGNVKAVPFYGFRGTGEHVDEALGYDDVADVYNYKNIGFHCTGKNALSIIDVKGDAALKTIGQNDESDTIFRVSDTVDASTGLVFETDIYFESVATTRSDKALFTFGATNELSGHYNLASGFGVGFALIDGAITVKAGKSNNSVTVDVGEWINLRYEVNYLAGQSNVALYINGELVISDKNNGGTYSSSFVYPTGVVMYNNGWNTTGTVTYLDNTYVGPLLDETYRGSGVYANNENTFTMDDVTGVRGSATTTNANIGLINKNGLAGVDVNGNAAIEGFGSVSYQNDVMFATSETLTKGDKFVAEFDIMFSNFQSTRADGEVLSVIGNNDLTKQNLLWNMSLLFKMVDGKCVLASGFSGFESVEIEASKWYTIRYEIDDVYGGKEHRIYVNGECVHTEAKGGGVYNGNFVYITGIDFYGYWNSAYSTFYIDNVYVGRP